MSLVAFKVPANMRVGFEALEFFEGAEPRVGVIQAHHKANHHFVVFHVVQKRTPVGHFIKRPTGTVQSQASLVACRVNFPQFFDANAVALRIFAIVQFELGNDLLAQVSPCAFCKHGVLGMKFHAQLEAVGGLTIFADAHVACGHAFDGAVVGVQNFCRRKARKDFNAQSFSLLAQPASEVAQADDVIAIVVEAGRQGKVGHARGARF